MRAIKRLARGLPSRRRRVLLQPSQRRGALQRRGASRDVKVEEFLHGYSLAVQTAHMALISVARRSRKLHSQPRQYLSSLSISWNACWNLRSRARAATPRRGVTRRMHNTSGCRHSPRWHFWRPVAAHANKTCRQTVAETSRQRVRKVAFVQCARVRLLLDACW